MASLTIRKLDDDVKRRLRIRAAEHGRSMEEEARDILESALVKAEPTGKSWVDDMRARFADIGGWDVELPPRDEYPREPPSFE